MHEVNISSGEGVIEVSVTGVLEKHSLLVSESESELIQNDIEVKKDLKRAAIPVLVLTF